MNHLEAWIIIPGVTRPQANVNAKRMWMDADATSELHVQFYSHGHIFLVAFAILNQNKSKVISKMVVLSFEIVLILAKIYRPNKWHVSQVSFKSKFTFKAYKFVFVFLFFCFFVFFL